MPAFSTRSLSNMKTLHPRLIAVANAAIQYVDFTVICTIRDKASQEQAYHLKRTRAHFGQSPHNYFPALAFDFIPYPFSDADWEDIKRFETVATMLKSVASKLGVRITWGGDFVNFKDTPHIELEHWRDYLGHEYTNANGVTGIVEPYISQIS